MNHERKERTMTPQERADAAEVAAIQRYAAMRSAWAPCWGRRPAEPSRPRGTRRAVRRSS